LLNKRQKAFIEAYATLGSDSYGNGAKSARKAGYSPKNPERIAVRLLKNVHINQQIEHKSQEYLEKSQKTREQKRAIAWDNYNKATKDRDKQFWWQEVCKLDGDYVTKVESENKNVNFNYSDIRQSVEIAKSEIEAEQAQLHSRFNN